HKLLDAVMVKATIGSSSLDQGRKRGLPLFGYLGSGEDLTQDNFDKARLQLTGENDALILPNRVSGALLEDDLLARARQACPTVWAYSTHRRSEVAYYYSRVVSGFVSTCSGYTGGVIKPLTAPDWSQGIEPGLLTLDPYSDTYAIDWSEGAGSITIGGLGKPAFVTLGDLGEMSYSTWELHVKAQVAAPRTSDDAAAMVETMRGTAPLLDRFVGCAMGYFAFMRAAGATSLMAEISAESLRNSVISRRFAEIDDNVRLTIRDELESAIARGEVPPIDDIDATIAPVMAATDGIALRQVGDPAMAPDRLEPVLRRMLAGMLGVAP
ncbi:MAG: TetR family transcriptional regulator C-terminal domain-containing protein, partial [Rhizobiales bacterium]|nr:TetR family transcriptional regulator C-terminal domain-containing protein [Hyphomicrobiales bacterium]